MRELRHVTPELDQLQRQAFGLLKRALKGDPLWRSEAAASCARYDSLEIEREEIVAAEAVRAACEREE